MILLVSTILACPSSIILANVGFRLLSHSLLVQGGILGLGLVSFTAIYFLVIFGLFLRFERIRDWLSFELGFDSMLRRIFLAVFLLFPLSVMLYVNLSVFAAKFPAEMLKNSWSLIDSFIFFTIIIILSCLFVILLIKLEKSNKQTLNKWPDYFYILPILVLGIAIRFYFISYINTQPESDFLAINNDAIRIAQGRAPSTLYSTTHVAITFLYGGLYKLFGINLSVLKFFHAFVYSLSGILIYFAGKRVFNSKLWGWVAGTLLVVWPSLMVYSNVLTPEHVFILVECAFLWIAVKLFEIMSEVKTPRATIGKRLFLFFIAGILLGLMGLFRPFELIFLVALIIVLVVYRRNTPLYVYLGGLIMLLIPYILLSQIPEAVVNYYHQKIPNIRPCNLLVGLNIESGGQWNQDDHYLCVEIMKNSKSDSEYTKKIIQVTYERFSLRQLELFPFLVKKFSVFWDDSYNIMMWGIRSAVGGDPYKIMDLALKLSLVELTVTLFMLIVCLIAVIIALFRDVKALPFFVMLVLLGFHLMEVPFEVQVRYRTVLMPMFILLACWAFTNLFLSFQKKQDVIS